jgi:AraC-like DNA-binding protein
VITTNPGEVHDGRPLGRPTRRWRIVYIEADLVSSMIEHRGGDAVIARPVIQDARLRRVLRRLFRRIEHWSCRPRVEAASALACEESLMEACVLLIDHHLPVSLPAAIPGDDMRRLREWLADDLLNPPTLTDMATMTRLSKYQIVRGFERAFGMPPHAWLLRQRAEHARVLIRNGSTLAAAAAASGFADQSHMTRVFVRQYGFTPGAWHKVVTPQ